MLVPRWVPLLYYLCGKVRSRDVPIEIGETPSLDVPDYYCLKLYGVRGTIVYNVDVSDPLFVFRGIDR